MNDVFAEIVRNKSMKKKTKTNRIQMGFEHKTF